MLYLFKFVEEADPCIPEPCVNAGLCSSAPWKSTGYLCNCQNDYFGDICADRKSTFSF